MKNEKLEKIRKILEEEYGGKMPPATIDSFAKELHYSLFVGEYDLEDIPATIVEYEADANIEDSGAWVYIFGQMVDLLENGEKTAQRLYRSFMHEFDLPDTFLKLVNENEEYIGAEQLAEAKKKAFSLFSREFLETCGITE